MTPPLTRRDFLRSTAVVGASVALLPKFARAAEPAGSGAWLNGDLHCHTVYSWDVWGGRVKLVVLPSPFRSLIEPLLEYIEQAAAEKTNDYVTVILPEFVPARWWQHLLHNQTSLLIKGALLFRPNIVVTSVPFHLTK